MGTASRRRALRRLLTEHPVHRQEELVQLLGRQGHRVSQSTVSRDLEAVGARKTPGEDGASRYSLGERETVPSPALAEALGAHLVGAAASGNLAVLHTPPGAADLVALALDRARLPGVLGTLAGDDTVLVVAAEGVSGADLVEMLERIAEVKR